MFSNNLRLLIDLDGVCADFYGRVVQWYNEDFTDTVKVSEVKSWDLNEHTYPKATHEYLISYFNVPGFWENLEPIEGCISSLGRLHKAGHEIVITTAIPDDCKLGFWEKSNWIKRHLPFVGHDNLIGAQKKERVAGSVLLDDGPHNLRDYEGLTCAMDAPYNQGVPADFRVKTWSEFEMVVEGLANESSMQSLSV